MSEYSFSLDVYTYNNIKKTMKVYREYSDIDEKTVGNSIILSFHNCRYPEDITVKEFENYLIGLESST